MKIAVTADIHCHEFKDYATITMVDWDTKKLEFKESTTGTPVNSRLIDALNTLIFMRDYCVDNNIEHLIIAGDLFHKRATLSVIVYNMTYRVIESCKKMGVTVHILAGNHDQVDNSDIPENSLYGLKQVANVYDSNTTIMLPDEMDNYDGQVEILFVPYSKNKDLMLEPIKEYEPDAYYDRTCTSSILVTHIGVDGAFVGKNKHVMVNKITPEDLMYHKFKYVVLGDYHKPQIVVGTDNMFYTGAPLQHNFNDEGEDRGFWVVDTLKRRDMQFIPINSPKFITITKENAGTVDLAGNFAKIQSNSSDIDDILEVVGEDSGIKIELQREIQEVNRSSIDISMDYKDIIKKYAEEAGASEYSDVGLSIYNEALSS